MYSLWALWIFLVMLFGLTNALVVLMGLMNWVFKQFLDQLVKVFIKDIFIFSKDAKEHEGHLQIALQTLKEKKFYVKFNKCEFWLNEVMILERVISNYGIYVDPKKVKTVVDWPMLTNVFEIRSFLRSCKLL